MTKNSQVSVWTDRIINILTIVIPIIIGMAVGFMVIKSDQAVLKAQMDDALVRQKGLEQSVAKILSDQSTIKANLQNYTDRLKRLEDHTAIIGALHQRIINIESRVLRLESDVSNLRNEKVLQKLID